MVQPRAQRVLVACVLVAGLAVAAGQGGGVYGLDKQQYGQPGMNSRSGATCVTPCQKYFMVNPVQIAGMNINQRNQLVSTSTSVFGWQTVPGTAEKYTWCQCVPAA